jgi:hypothetical protein
MGDGRGRLADAATAGFEGELKSSSMMATASLTTTPSGVGHPGDGKSPAQAPLPSLVLPVRDTIEEFAEGFMIFRVPGAAWPALPGQ